MKQCLKAAILIHLLMNDLMSLLAIKSPLDTEDSTESILCLIKSHKYPNEFLYGEGKMFIDDVVDNRRIYANSLDSVYMNQEGQQLWIFEPLVSKLFNNTFLIINYLYDEYLCATHRQFGIKRIVYTLKLDSLKNKPNELKECQWQLSKIIGDNDNGKNLFTITNRKYRHEALYTSSLTTRSNNKARRNVYAYWKARMFEQLLWNIECY